MDNAKRTGAVVLAGGLAVGVGALTTVNPLLAVAASLSIVPVLLIGLGRRMVELFFSLWLFVLIGYLFFSRGFAYFGVPPVYVGDLVLGIAVLTVIVSASRARVGTVHFLLIGFMLLGLLRTFPYLGTDGIDAMRDGALWGYAFYALAISFALRRDHVARLVNCYRSLLPYFVAWVPPAAVLGLVFYSQLPTWPGSGVPVIAFKGDMGVHLAAAAAFILLGLYSYKRTPRSHVNLLWLGWFASAITVAAINRGAMLSLLVAVTATIFLRATGRQRWPFLGLAALLVTVVAFVNPSIDLGRTQDISLGQVVQNVSSVVGDSEESSLEGNEKFRLDWWGTIWGYTVNGPYFWTGKGFGVNLGDSDGFAIDTKGTLRAPHNTHMTVLARMGVPGFVLWLTLQAAFAFMLFRAFRRTSRLGAVWWSRFNAWLLVYWLAMMVNTSFDPYLEGPQGAIWFWSIFGLGLAALRMQRDSLEEPSPVQPAGEGRP